VEIKHKIFSCTNKDELAHLRSNGGYSPNELSWVWENFLDQKERQHINLIAQTSQASLFDGANTDDGDRLPKVGDTIFARSLGREILVMEIHHDHLVYCSPTGWGEVGELALSDLY
jgi:hypothetical protein